MMLIRTDRDVNRFEKARANSRMQTGVTEAAKRLFLFELELAGGLVLVEESAKFFAGVQQAGPLLVIEGDRKAAESVNADAALFANAKIELTGAAAGSLLFHLSQA